MSKYIEVYNKSGADGMEELHYDTSTKSVLWNNTCYDFEKESNKSKKILELGFKLRGHYVLSISERRQGHLPY